MYSITWTDRNDQSWARIPSCKIGDVPGGLGTPEKYIILSQQNAPILRVDAYASSEETFTFTEAIVWHGFLTVGWGNHVYLIHIESRAIIRHAFNSYFGHLYETDECLLVATAERLIRIAPDGSIAWQSDVLGIDGVTVDDVDNGIVAGSGEWDPPGGWQPFQICLDSGQLNRAT